ncbi:Glycerol uptake facilitator (Major Intrinsic Protein Family) [Litoreibacter ascidiaceicola]|uniref:Glycerol uptake facilitator (Major Intrinsic Protein Family) n=1 Tax=Litoreibacter ascidiaceicola TaxID=1486859 RepID=A0A1M4WA94_9RHOB|nr:MIP/aquaporin family protein [Litoreibacter ascidiaceicola]SHE77882.1 Glycerol uptake facilitator (Major Intrinsic Protein Family) [Litoreibacter ascidiaceicola]
MIARQIAAEALGTALLLISVVGSGIMGESLAGGNTAIALLANAIATGCMLYAIITVLGPISGAHFNPAVTLAFLMRWEITPKLALAYVVAQVAGGILGVWITHLMFDLPILQLSTTARAGIGQWSAEAVAMFGLLFVIFGGLAARADSVPTLVALYITGAYWFTASTSFANPAVSVARSLTDTFAGILPSHAPGFVAVQLLTTLIAIPLLGWLFGRK